MYAQPSPLVPFVVDAATPSRTIARITLTLTCYITEPLVWARGGAAECLRAFLELAGPRQPEWFTSSMTTSWLQVNDDGMAELYRRLSDWSVARPRHLFWLRFADDANAPSCGFSYREVDPALGRRTGFLQLTLPPDARPDELEHLARLVASRWPVACGVGGFAPTWNDDSPATAFDAIYLWCRRYAGLDVQLPDKMAWRVLDGLPGVGWLNVFGHAYAGAIDLDVAALGARAWAHGTRVEHFDAATIVRAGDAPTLGDVNRLAFPQAYTEVARALEPHLVAEPPELPGRFEDQARTALWFRRLVDPAWWKPDEPPP